MKIEVRNITAVVGVGFDVIPLHRIFQIGENVKALYLKTGVDSAFALREGYYGNFNAKNFGGADYRVLPEGTQVIITT